MYHFKICNRIKLLYFLNFIIHEINSEMIKFEIIVVTRKEKYDMTDADMTVR
jgi:hypothetical protein